MKETRTLYGVSIEVFYIVSRFAWKLSLANLGAFQTFKAVYTSELIANALKAIDAAEGLQTTRQAQANRKMARVSLLAPSKAVRQNWQFLKSYILEAFDKDTAGIQLESAGASLYKKGATKWSAVAGLFTAANDYITNNLETLQQHGHMPHEFAENFRKAGEPFTTALHAYQLTDLVVKNTTAAKLAANNSIYETLVAMLKDGQLVFKKDPTMREQFTYDFLVAMNRGGVASLRGSVKDSNGIALAGATITSLGGKYKGITDAQGRYNITRMEGGDSYTFTVVKAGYINVQKVVKVKAGQANNFNVTLTAAVQAEVRTA